MANITEQGQVVVGEGSVHTKPSTMYAPLPVHGRALFVGVFVSLGAWLLLHVLGLGIGLASVNPDYPESLRGVGVGTGLWSVAAPLIAFFIGGLAAGRVAGPMPRVAGIIHGAVLWSITTVGTMVVLLYLVSAIVGGVARLGGSAIQATGSLAERSMASAEGVDLASLGLSSEDMVAPINRRLEAAGKPPVTADQLSSAARDALRSAVRQGRIDRQVLIDSLAAKTALSRDDAAEVAAAIEQSWNARLSGVGAAAQRTALEAVDATGKALLGFFFVALVGLAASIIGTTLVSARLYDRTLAMARTSPRRP